MAYGMNVYNASGVLRLGMSDRTFRVLAAVTVAQNSTGSFSVPGFDGTKGIAFAVTTSFSNFITAHEVSWSGTTIYYGKPSYYASSPSLTPPWGASLIVVVMYG